MPKTKKPKISSAKGTYGSAKPKSKPKPKATKKNTKPSTKPKVETPVPLGPLAKPKVVKQPCCTDVLKTGQAFTVPLGFSDYKGTMRIQEPTVSTKDNVLGSVASVKQTVPSLIFVQPTDMGEPTTLDSTKGITKGITDVTIMRPGPVRTGVKKTIRVPKPAQLSPIPEPAQFSFVPPNYEEVQASISRTIRVPRKNSRAELENRYEAMTGSRYSGPNLTNAEFRQMVEFISNKKNV
jgi:hypothetical protein